MPHQVNNARLRTIPSTHRVLAALERSSWAAVVPRRKLVAAIRLATEALRQSLREKPSEELALDDVAARVREILSRQEIPRLRRVINATGIILHTNLGRAPLPEDVVTAIQEVAEDYCNLEIDLETGDRSERHAHVEEILTRLTGAEAALVVNNDAAAVLLVLDTFAKGKEVIVSRGELIEIGGSFRLPDIMAKSGARLVEVGTTNRTYIRDYEAAITSETALLFKAHTSNYAVIGFAASPPSQELAALGTARGIPTVVDLGNGLLRDLAPLGFSGEPLVQGQVAAGIDLVAWSGDKLLGGPQGGVIVGRRAHLDRLKRNPLTRAVRVDKLHLAALEATLRYYEEERWQELPLYRMLTLKNATVKKRAKALATALERSLGEQATVSIRAGTSEVGGGTLPSLALSTQLVAIRPRSLPVDVLAQRLRLGNPPLVGRIQKDHVVLDPRTIPPDDLSKIPALFATACMS